MNPHSNLTIQPLFARCTDDISASLLLSTLVLENGNHLLNIEYFSWRNLKTNTIPCGKIQGLKLELCTSDRPGLLSDVTRIFRENSLSVTQAEVSTRGGKAINTFYVRDASGYPVDSKTIDTIRQSIGQTILKVKGRPKEWKQDASQESQSRFLFGGLFKSRSFCNFGLVRSYS